jgi:hypothetical protein
MHLPDIRSRVCHIFIMESHKEVVRVVRIGSQELVKLLKLDIPTNSVVTVIPSVDSVRGSPVLEFRFAYNEDVYWPTLPAEKQC